MNNSLNKFNGRLFGLPAAIAQRLFERDPDHKFIAHWIGKSHAILNRRRAIVRQMEINNLSKLSK